MSQMENRRLWIVGVLLIVLLVLLGLCCVGWLVVRRALPDSQEKGSSVEVPGAPEFTIAYSPEKEAIVNQLVSSFNADVAALSDDVLEITAVRYEADLMIEAALDGKVQAISPDSSIWLDVLDREWAARTGREAPLVGQWERYAVSPVVIAMWEDVARSMGYPDKALGWADLLNRARSDPEFKWSHPSTNSSAGLLATMAMFYAGANKTRDLAEADVLRQGTLDYVAAVEQTVRYYGEGEWSVAQRLLREGRAYLDAFVCQEQLVVYMNERLTEGRLVAVYPVEGALWVDHPLALLETDGLTDRQRATFKRFVEYAKSRDTQLDILADGYRPTDLNISLSSPESPLTAERGVDPAQPKTTLQMPSPGVIQVIRDVWWYTKRHTNVYLVADVSGSMEGDKLDNAQQALRVFVDEIKGDMERVGLVRFSTNASEVVSLGDLGQNRAEVVQAIDRLEAGGDTALLDAVDLAYGRLQSLGDGERINAVVVMTDGQENYSRISLGTLIERIQDGNARGVPVIVFCIGYGDDADEAVLRAIAESSGGQYYTGDLDTIRRLYKILSSYF
jgi:Ca-activated chloride channel family protein